MDKLTVPYSAIARYDYKATDDAELSLKKKMTVKVEQVNDSGWCLVSLDDSKAGWVPASYLEPIVNTTPKVASRPSAGHDADDEGEGQRKSDKSVKKVDPRKAKPKQAVKGKSLSSSRSGTKPGASEQDDLPPPPPAIPDDEPPPPPPPAPADDVPPPPPPKKGDDGDSSDLPDSNEDTPEEKEEDAAPKPRRRKKMQDILRNERAEAAHEIFKLYDDSAPAVGETADGGFDRDMWMAEMLDQEEDPPPPPEIKAGQLSESEWKRIAQQERDRAATSLAEAISYDKKKRQVEKGKTDLDLSYITDRVIAMAYPSEAPGTKHTLINVKKFLDKNHDRHTKIYNFCTEKSYPPEKFRPIPINTSFQFDGKDVPFFHTLLDVCKSISEYLKTDDANVVALHCSEGGRTGLVVCCYLIFAGVCNSASQALRYYAAFRGKQSMRNSSPSQMRYLNYFELYMIVLKKHQASGAIDKLTARSDVSDGRGKDKRSSAMVSSKSPALVKKMILDFVCPLQYVVLKYIDLTPIPKILLGDSVGVWFRVTHADFQYESKARVKATRNTKQNKMQFSLPDKTDKEALPLLFGDLKLEVFYAKGITTKILLQCWFNTRFLENEKLDGDLEDALDIIKKLENKSIAKWDALDKQLYQESMDTVRRHRKKEVLTSDEPTPDGKKIPASPSADSSEVEGKDYDVFKLRLEKKKLDLLCGDADNKISDHDFHLVLTFHKPKVDNPSPSLAAAGGTPTTPISTASVSLTPSTPSVGGRDGARSPT